MKLRLLCLVLSVVSLTCFAAPSILVEAEGFDDCGGWFGDTQFMDIMGSPYLLAHGTGKPVDDATTVVECSEAGEYRVWVRTFDWVARWRGRERAGRKQARGEAPGRFSILLDDKAIEGIFGTEAANWHWHKVPFETGVPEDVKRLKLIKAESGITLLLNHRANGVELDGTAIKAVLAANTKTGQRIRLKGKLFADCTGDGCIGALANADFAMCGKGHMGRSNLWFIEDTGKPTTFPRCPWGLDLYGYKLPKPSTKIDGWYWESGFNHDPINDGEYIRDWNLRAVYGYWDALKNYSKEYPTHRIKWLAYVSGKRESRRLLGDAILDGQDILSGRKFEDGCVPLTWRLDVHRPDPRYVKEFEGDEFIAVADVYGKAESKYKGPYWMPYRCLYSRDVPNLFMAGRNVSTTQSALGAARVQRNTGMQGEVVGKAAPSAFKTTPCQGMSIQPIWIN